MNNKIKEVSNKTKKPNLELSLDLAKKWLENVDDETFYKEYLEIKNKKE
ncbi:TPA: hypothetical protein NV714_005767 [Escherichia coli]|nr:hypothetical protein [Escherichia coli]